MVAVLTHDNAPRLADTGDAELAVLQSDEVAFRGQFVGAVVAETPETARHAARARAGRLRRGSRTTSSCAPTGTTSTRPDKVNPGFPTDTEEGDVDAALAAAAVTSTQTYTTPMEHNNPMEPHTTSALWDAAGPTLTLYDSTQGVHAVRRDHRRRSSGSTAEQVRVDLPARRRRVRLQGARRTPTPSSPRWPRGPCPGGR